MLRQLVLKGSSSLHAWALRQAARRVCLCLCVRLQSGNEGCPSCAACMQVPPACKDPRLPRGAAGGWQLFNGRQRCRPGCGCATAIKSGVEIRRLALEETAHWASCQWRTCCTVLDSICTCSPAFVQSVGLVHFTEVGTPAPHGWSIDVYLSPRLFFTRSVHCCEALAQPVAVTLALDAVLSRRP